MPLDGGAAIPTGGEPGSRPEGTAGRRRRFEEELARVRRTDGTAGREHRWLAVGACSMVAGAATALVAFIVSLNAADTRDVVSMVVLAGFGACLSIAGAALFLRHSLSRVLRLMVLRLLFEQQQNGDGVSARDDRITETGAPR